MANSPVSGGFMGLSASGGGGSGAEGFLRQATTSAANGANSMQAMKDVGNLATGVFNFVTGKSRFSNVVNHAVNDGNNAKDEYIVRITSEQCGTVEAILQEKISFGMKSTWDSVTPTALGDLANTFTQFFGEKAAVNTLMSRRMWKGSEPITISMSLQFWAASSAQKEVLDPIKTLMKMAAPSKGKALNKWLGSDINLLDPPGPSPFTSESVLRTQTNKMRGANIDKQDLKGGDFISISIGKYLRFDNVILNEPQITIENKVTRGGLPIRGEAVVTFQTYTIYTKEDIEEMFSPQMMLNVAG